MHMLLFFFVCASDTFNKYYLLSVHLGVRVDMTQLSSKYHLQVGLKSGRTLA